MKIIQIPYCFYPDPVGGTDVFVAQLALDLQRSGIETVVAAPAGTTHSYTSRGLRVRRFAHEKNPTDLETLYGVGDVLAETEFAKILDDERPDIVHLHSFTAAVSMRTVRAAKSRGVSVIFTYHTPTVSCQRGTLLYRGKTVCNGKLAVRACTACTLNGLGLPWLSSAALAAVPPSLGRILAKVGLQGGAWTALRMSALMELHLATINSLVSEVDHFVAVSDWVQNLLLQVGVSETKISVCRQGVYWSQDKLTSTRSSGPVNLVFVGRFDPVKGLQVVIDALKLVPTLPVTLDVYGVTQNRSHADYRDEMLSRSLGDSRITFKGALPSDQVVDHLRGYDFLIVPSQSLETGPMVVLEAFAAGVPVIGWNTGGVKEVVRNGIDGLLIEPGPIQQWADVFKLVVGNAALRVRLRSAVRSPRTNMDVVRDMSTIYAGVLASKDLTLSTQSSQNAPQNSCATEAAHAL